MGACEGGNTSENSRVSQYFADKDCRERCDMNSMCTGFVLPVSGANWCQTYTSIGATGDGRDSYYCYMKHGNIIT